MVDREQLDKQVSIKRDLLGQPVETTLDNKTLTVSYSDQANRYRVDYVDGATGARWSEFYDERGLLRSVETALPTVSQTVFTYDALGRLLTETTTADGDSTTQTYSYYEQIGLVTRVDGPAGIVHTQNYKNGGACIISGDGSSSIAGQTDIQPGERSVDGRQVTGERAAVGTVVAHRDNHGSPIMETDGTTEQTTTYGQLQVTTEDKFNSNKTTTTFTDDYRTEQILEAEDKKITVTEKPPATPVTPPNGRSHER